MKVICAPDFRELVPYQRLLGEGLAAHGVETVYQSGYHRGMPLLRGVIGRGADLLHLHFPNHYFLKYSDYLSRFARAEGLRKLRFFLDLHLTTTAMPLVYSVHDLLPINHRVDFLIRLATRYTLSRAAAVITHSETVRNQVISEFGVAPEKCSVILHGDLSAAYGPPLPQTEAREKLGLGGEKICLIFGSIEPYKGIDELVAFWQRERPDCTLVIAGRAMNDDYMRMLENTRAGLSSVVIRPGFTSDDDLRLWFSAADCAAVNYRRIYTSGIASLARSWGLPVLLPARLKSVELHEPHPSVIRYENVENDFRDALSKALRQPRDYAAAAAWRSVTSWGEIAAQTSEVYRRVLPKFAAA